MNFIQTSNPILPSYEYLSDAEIRHFNGRLYLYGAHNKYNGMHAGYGIVCWSANPARLDQWQFEGIVLSREQLHKTSGMPKVKSLLSPDVTQGADGRYYLYFSLGFTSRIGVAVCDTPGGKYNFLGCVRYEDGAPLGSKNEPFQFDPSIMQDNGATYLFTGFAGKKSAAYPLGNHLPTQRGAMAFTLKKDMLTVTKEPVYIGAGLENGAKNSFTGHEFLKAPSMWKINGKYYFVYTAVSEHEICYAVGNSPLGPFTYAGVLLSTGDYAKSEDKTAKRALTYSGDTHGSLLRLHGEFYIIYPRQTHHSLFSAQACAEKLYFADGSFKKAGLTSSGLNGRALRGIGEYKAKTVCHLFPRKGAFPYLFKKTRRGSAPYLKQKGKDRNHTPLQFIANFRHGATAGFRYFLFDGANQIIVTVRGNQRGKLIVSEQPNGLPLAKIRLTPCKEFTDFYAPLQIGDGVRPLYFTYEGTGKFDFKGFTLQQVVRGLK